MNGSASARHAERLVHRISALCRERGARVAVVESLTSGALSSALGRGDDAADWFRGGIIAYHSSVKHTLLAVPTSTDPCSPECAEQLARSGRGLLESDVCVSVTGVGGPDPSDGHAPGEVHVGVATVSDVHSRRQDFGGSPADVVDQSVVSALEEIHETLMTLVLDRDHDHEIVISRIRQQDAGEVLTVQRAAFVSEAQLYGSADTAPLTQTLEQLEAELAEAQGWVARRQGRLVGAVRTRQSDGVLLIGRIAIAPDVQGEGIGRRLLAAAETSSDADMAELFTGSLSEGNLRLYHSCGYEESERVDQGDGTAQVFLRKPLTAP